MLFANIVFLSGFGTAIVKGGIRIHFYLELEQVYLTVSTKISFYPEMF